MEYAGRGVASQAGLASRHPAPSVRSGGLGKRDSRDPLSGRDGLLPRQLKLKYSGA